MIICFSGTGNSRRVADQLQDILGDDLIRLAPGLMLQPSKVNLHVSDGRVIWIFPVHCWDIPPVTREVMEKATITSSESCVHYMICTCGDDVGLTHRHWRKVMEQRGWKAVGAFSVQMPNNYVFMKGFDVDSPEVAEQKLRDATVRVEAIADIILSGRTDAIDDVVPGSWAWVKSKIVNPWFRKYKYSTKPFHVTDDCTGCGWCARNCPVMCIWMGDDSRPMWGDYCLMCSRCYHICPNRAIRYGDATDDKGQYICPGYTLHK